MEVPVHHDNLAAELILYGRALGLGHGESEDLVHDAFRALMDLAERRGNRRTTSSERSETEP